MITVIWWVVIPLELLAACWAVGIGVVAIVKRNRETFDQRQTLYTENLEERLLREAFERYVGVGPGEGDWAAYEIRVGEILSPTPLHDSQSPGGLPAPVLWPIPSCDPPPFMSSGGQIDVYVMGQSRPFGQIGTFCGEPVYADYPTPLLTSPENEEGLKTTDRGMDLC